MKKTICLLLLSAVLFNLFADEEILSCQELKSKYYTFEKMGRWGTILLFTGGILAIVGGKMLVNNDSDYNSAFLNSIGGSTLLAVSGELVGGGITFSIIGSKKKDEYKRKYHSNDCTRSY